MNIYQALNQVMTDVGAVAKADKNQSQGFRFRGIDAVVNAVSPALRKHGVIVYPTVIETAYDTVSIGSKGTQMGHCRGTICYTFVAQDGSHVTATVVAESMDSGDKATAKMMSVAYRTALLQTLCLPTDDIDPDAETYERSAQPTERRVVSSGAPRPAHPEADPEGPIVRPTGVLTKTQKTWVDKQCFGRGTGDTLTEVSRILGRNISSLDEVSNEDKAVLLPALSGTA